jgi:hypothetical protein
MFQKGNVANPKGRGKGVLGRATLLSREFASKIVDDPAVMEKILGMARAGTLPAPTLNLILMYRYGRPKHIVEVQQPQAVSRKDLLARLTPVERRQLNELNMAMLARAAADAAPRALEAAKTELEAKADV